MAGFDEYMKRAGESEGFDVNSVGRHLCGGIVELDLTPKGERDMIIEVAKDAIKQYNDANKSNLVFDSLVKSNGQVVGGYMFYITFTVRSPTGDDQPMLYQAKVWETIHSGFKVLIFRPFQNPGKRARKRKFIFEKEDTPSEWPSSMHKKKTVEKEARPPLPKGAFFSFMRGLRKVPELANMGNCNVTHLASMKWKSMSAELHQLHFMVAWDVFMARNPNKAWHGVLILDVTLHPDHLEKAKYCRTRSLKYEDVAGFMSTVVSAHGE